MRSLSLNYLGLRKKAYLGCPVKTKLSKVIKIMVSINNINYK